MSSLRVTDFILQPRQGAPGIGRFTELHIHISTCLSILPGEASQSIDRQVV